MKEEKYTQNMTFKIWRNDDGSYQHEQVSISLLMDIRHELQRLNRSLGGGAVLEIQRTLRNIAANTKKPAKRRAKKWPKTSA